MDLPTPKPETGRLIIDVDKRHGVFRDCTDEGQEDQKSLHQCLGWGFRPSTELFCIPHRPAPRSNGAEVLPAWNQRKWELQSAFQCQTLFDPHLATCGYVRPRCKADAQGRSDCRQEYGEVVRRQGSSRPNKGNQVQSASPSPRNQVFDGGREGVLGGGKAAVEYEHALGHAGHSPGSMQCTEGHKQCC